MVIIIPLEFEKKILRNESTTISAYGDATNRLANGLLQQDMTAAYQEMLLIYHQDTLSWFLRNSDSLDFKSNSTRNDALV